MCPIVFSSKLDNPQFGTRRTPSISWRISVLMVKRIFLKRGWVTTVSWMTMPMKLVSTRSFKGLTFYNQLTRTVCRIHLTEENSIRLYRHGDEVATTVDKLNLRLSEARLGIGSLDHGNGRLDDHLLTLLDGLLVTTAAALLDGTLLLYVHHTPNDEDEHEGVHEETHSRGATRGGGDPGTQNSPDETESLGVRDDEEGKTRNHGDDKLLLLLLTVAPTSTIFKKTHDYF